MEWAAKGGRGGNEMEWHSLRVATWV